MSAVDLQVSTALLNARPALQFSARNEAEAEKVARDFEAVFVNEILGPMFEGIKTDGPFGGGPSEAIFRSMMIDQYSKTIAAQGGFGLADAVKRQILQLQEMAK